jgi:methyl-accepting chemotaxis protein
MMQYRDHMKWWFVQFDRVIMRISRKLPFAAAFVTLFAISAATAVNLYIQRETLFQQTAQKLEAISDGRRNEAKIYLDSIKLDLLARAASPSTTQALYGFLTPWPKLGDDPAAVLQKRYIEDNPNPVGEKQKLDSARQDSYDRAHAAYHPALRAHLEAQGYYDIFLVDLFSRRGISVPI